MSKWNQINFVNLLNLLNLQMSNVRRNFIFKKANKIIK